MTHNKPSIDNQAIDFSAGCLAKIKAPKPSIVVTVAKNMEDLCDDKTSFPDLNFCVNPSVMKMLKSSPKPKMD